MTPRTVLVPVLAAASMTLAAPASGQSLAQIAREAAARRQEPPCTVPVYTNEDLSRSGPRPTGDCTTPRGPVAPEPPVQPAQPASVEPAVRRPVPSPVEPTRGVYELSIAGTDVGSVRVLSTPDEVWVERQALERSGLRPGVGSHLQLEDVSYVGLVSLRWELGYELDELNAILRLTSRATRLVPSARGGMTVASRAEGRPTPPAETIIGTTDSGRARVRYQYNRNTIEQPLLWLGPLSTVVIPPTTHGNLRVESQQYVSNVGLVESSVDVRAGAGPLAATSGSVGVSDVGIGSSRITLRAGDRPLGARTLDLNVAALQQPSVGIRGGLLEITRGDTRVHAFGGRTMVMGGYFGESVLTSDQMVFGAEFSGRRTQRLRFGARVLRTEGHDGWDEVTPERATSVSATTIFDPTPHVRLTADASVARFRPSAAVAMRPGTRLDASYVVAGRLSGQRGSAEVDLMRLGPAYLPLSFSRLGDRSGFLGSGDYRFGRTQIDGSAQRWSTNVGGWSAAPRYDLHTALFGLRQALTEVTSLGARVGLSGIEQSRAPAPFSNTSRNMNADWSHQRGGLLIATRLSDILARQAGPAPQESERRRLDFDLRRAWPRGSSIGGTLGLVRERVDGTTRSGLAGGLTGSWSPGPRASFYSEVNYNQEFAGLAAFRVDTVAATAGADVNVGRGFRLLLNGRAIRDASVLGGADFRLLSPEGQNVLERQVLDRLQGRYQFTVSIQKDLSWGARPAVRRSAGTAPSLPRDVGRIEGQVFGDFDADGQRGAAEVGVADVVVRLDGVFSARIDATGRFTFESVPAGAHTLSIDLRTVPATYGIGSRETNSVRVKKRGVATVDIPLVLLGKIRGRAVTIERISADGRRLPGVEFSPEVRPLPGVLVQLDGSGRTTLTDADGEFEFSGVVQGRHTVRLVPGSLPVSIRLERPREVELVLAPGQKLEDLELAVPVPSPALRRAPSQ